MKRFRIVACTLMVIASQISIARAAVSGAIFTTTADGAIVNANTQYTSKCAVYLDGGPGNNAPAKAAGLPAGDYFFQVTDPNGKTLLNTDPVSNRRFTVSTSGVITAYTGVGGPVHPTGTDQDHPELGAITISLANTSCPADFLDTPNAGGVYKVWVTPVASFVGDATKVDNSCGNGCYHGFMSSASKTDNFKVQPVTATFCLSVTKYGQDQFNNTALAPFWPFTITDRLGVTNAYDTGATGTMQVCSLVAGSYTVTEDPQGSDVIDATLNGADLGPVPSIAVTWSAGQTQPAIVFINYLPVTQ